MKNSIKSLTDHWQKSNEELKREKRQFKEFQGELEQNILDQQQVQNQLRQIQREALQQQIKTKEVELKLLIASTKEKLKSKK